MALKIRLSRIGAIHRPVYHVVVAEARSRRDGRAVEILGTYSPLAKGPQLKLDAERADYWIGHGAKPTDTALTLIKRARNSAATAGVAAEAPTETEAPVEA